MLPEIGATELIVIAAVALIVVGPKDLPVLMRKVGRFMARMRGMAAEFRSSFDEMARQSELDELRNEVEALRQGKFMQPVVSDLDDSFRSLDADLRPNSVMSGAYEPEPEPYADPAIDPEPEPAPEPSREARVS
jgi:sec-independent protein translocase protein TatB